MTNDATHPPIVFISYSHDSQEHADRVLALSDKLRSDGIDCVLDQYEVSPPEGWPLWMDQQIRAADFVLMICTPTYFRRVMGQEEPGTGLGVRWEGNLIYQHIFNKGSLNTQFIAILLEGANTTDIPTPLQGATYYRLSTATGYEELYRRLTGQPFTPKPALGMRRTLPPRERIRDFIQQQSGKSPLEVIENVPYARNPYFTGRDTILHDLHEALSKDSATALTQGYAISGLGGIGKTQTTMEYSYRYRSEYHYIFWIRAETEVALQAGFVEIAKLLDLPEQNATNPADTVQAVKHWLEHTGEWLLVYDNADSPEMLTTYYPHKPKGHILLTSRAQVFDTLGIDSTFALEKMDPHEALDFLFKRTKHAQSDPKEKHAAEQLAKELGYLPLALEQAAAYIVTKTARFQDYLASFQQRRLSLLSKAGPKTGNYPASVAKTWSLNFQEVEQVPVSADIMRVSVFLSPDAIPLELLIEGASQLSPVIASTVGTEEPLALNEALEPLTRYSLIRVDIENQTYSIHRMVQEVLKDQMGAELQAEWAERVVRAVSQSFPKVDYQTWSRCERLIPHVLLCAEYINHWSMTSWETRYLLNEIGNYFIQRGQYKAAEPLLKSALAICEQVLGSEHPSTLSCVNNLGLLYWNQGKFEQAEPLYQRALETRERVLGPEHPDTLQTVNNLAILYRNQGKFEEAEPLYQRVLTTYERVLGPEHPDTLQTVNNLGVLYRNQGKYQQAEPLYQRALETRERVLGPEHPDTLQTVNNLGVLYWNQGKFEEVEPLYQRALETRERVLGPEHPDTLQTVNNLALLFADQGKYEQAEPLYQRALTTYERVLGPEHPTTVIVRNNYTNLQEKLKQRRK